MTEEPETKDQSIFSTWHMLGPYLIESDLNDEQKKVPCLKKNGYHGQYVDEGQGRIRNGIARIHKDEYLYEGDVFCGAISGSGRMIYKHKNPSDQMFYQGNFKKGKRHGEGVLCYVDGS